MNTLGLDAEISRNSAYMSDLLTGSTPCSGCQVILTLHIHSKLFNSASVNLNGVVEPLFVMKHINCVPFSLVYLEEAAILI